MTTGASKPRWRWRRWVRCMDEEMWLGRLAWLDYERIIFTSKPHAKRMRLDVYGSEEAEKHRLLKECGGQAEAIREAWMRAPQRTLPLRVCRDLYVVDDAVKVAACEREHPGARALSIPATVAFGTGEHETTGMAMRELVRHHIKGLRVLDAGTGSGLLALVARERGAASIEAFDFDPDCLRVAKQNEETNFSGPMISWHEMDVAKWPKRKRYDIVIANLYSQLLILNADRLAGWVAPGGSLLATGIFIDQEGDVSGALRRAGLEQTQRRRRGRWVMLRLCRA